MGLLLKTLVVWTLGAYFEKFIGLLIKKVILVWHVLNVYAYAYAYAFSVMNVG